MPDFTKEDFATALRTYGGTASKKVAENPKLLKSMFDLAKAVHTKDAIAGIAASASVANQGAKAYMASNKVQLATKSTAFVTSEFKATMDMAKVMQLTSPASIYVFVGATMVQKTGLVVSLVGTNNEKAVCTGALMELSANVAMTAVTAPTGVFAALAAVSLTLSALNAYQACLVPVQQK